MAIVFIGSQTQDSGGAQSLTFTIPAGAQSDDFMVAFVKQSENTGGQVWDDDGGGGNGWIRLAYNRTTSGRDQETAIYYKTHTGTENNPTFTWNSGGTNEPMSGSILVYRGVDTLNPIADFAHANATNDANPPNPSVTVSATPATILVFHAATHDDISSVAAPTGYTLRTQVWSGTANDHRNHFTADLIGLGTTGSYTPPDWQHSVLNTTPEYHTYTLALQEQQVIGVTDVDGDDAISKSQQNVVVTGFGFEAAQGTGTLELWDDLAGTTQVTQTIDSWSDTSIQFDVVAGALSDGFVYVVVTNDSGEESVPFQVQFGIPPYSTIIQALSPDHEWILDGDYNDTGITGPVRNMTNGVVGSAGFVATQISEGTTQSWRATDVLQRREIADSPNMNITISSQERTVAAWIMLGGIQQSLGSIWKEGGGVQNLAMLVGIGNVFMWQLADVAATRDNVQAVSSIRLTPNRPYLMIGRYSHLDNPAESRLYRDGTIEPLALTSGNPMTLGIFDSHSGDVTWLDPDNNLETGGTDIAYAGQEDCYLSRFMTWSDNSAGPNAGGLSDTEIYSLFERGAVPDDIIATATQANMQIAMDAFANTSRPDWPLSFRIEDVTGGGDLELTVDNVTFDDGITLQFQWYGAGTLTLVQQNGTVIDTSKFSTPGGGTIVVESDLDVAVTVRDISSGTPIQDARVYLTADTGGPLAQGTIILNDVTNASGLASTTLRYSADQPIVGYVRKGSSAPYYRQTGIAGTMTAAGFNITALMVSDE